MTDWVISESSYSHEIDVPIDQVDIADRLAHLRNAEFQRCCAPDHIACGFTHNAEGQPMSINVETIGKSLLMQQYVAEVFESHLCRMVSVSDVFPFNRRETPRYAASIASAARARRTAAGLI